MLAPGLPGRRRRGASTRPASRSARRSSGWTGGPRRRPTSCGTRSARSGCTQHHRAGRRPVAHRAQDRLDPGRAARGLRRGRGLPAGRRLPGPAADRAAGHRPRQRLVQPAVRRHRNVDGRQELLDVVGRRAASSSARSPSRATSPAPLTAEAAERLGLTTDCVVLVGTGDDHAGRRRSRRDPARPGRRRHRHGRTGRDLLAAAVLDDEALLETHAHAVDRASTSSRTRASSPAAASCGSPGTCST